MKARAAIEPLIPKRRDDDHDVDDSGVRQLRRVARRRLLPCVRTESRQLRREPS